MVLSCVRNWGVLLLVRGMRLPLFTLLLGLSLPVMVGADLADPTVVSAAELEAFKDREQQYWDAWERMAWAEIEDYYSMDPNSMYFDSFAVKLMGSDEYLKTDRAALSNFTSAVITIGDDFTLIKRGKLAVTGYSWRATLTGTNGSTLEMERFMTNVWTTENGLWVIAHRHNSKNSGAEVVGNTTDFYSTSANSTSTKSTEYVAERRSWVHQGIASPTDIEKETFRQLEEDLWGSWGKRARPDDAAHLYTKDADALYFDMGARFIGWSDYEAISLEVLKNTASATVTIAADFTLLKNDDLAVTIFTTKSEFTSNSGETRSSPIRTTDVWVRDDGRWIIVHQHVSVP